MGPLGIKHKNTRDSKWKNILKSRHFRSFFFITFLFTTIIFIIGGVVITLQNRMKLHENLEMKANYVALSVQDNLSNMKNSAVFMGNLASIERVLEAKSPTLDQLVRMTNDVTPYSTLYHYESICLFFNRSQRIFDSSGGMYDYDDFYDKELIETLENMKGEEMWLINVPYKRYYSPDPAVAVITYARRLPLYKSQGRGYVTVSYSLGRLQKAAAEAAGYTPYTATVCFQDHLLWSSSDAVMKNWANGLTASENEGLLLPGTTAFSSFSTIGARCSFHASKLELLTAVSATLLQWFLIYLAAAAADFAASMVYGMIMLRPVDAIMKKIGINPYTEIPGVREDEFSLISTALDNLNAQLSDIGTVMHENQQLVRERLLSGILYNYVDITSLPPEYEEHGLLFPFPYYAVILISLPSLDQMEDYTRREQLKLVIRTNTTNAFSALGTAVAFRAKCKIFSRHLQKTILKTEKGRFKGL